MDFGPIGKFIKLFNYLNLVFIQSGSVRILDSRAQSGFDAIGDNRVFKQSGEISQSNPIWIFNNQADITENIKCMSVPRFLSVGIEKNKENPDWLKMKIGN